MSSLHSAAGLLDCTIHTWDGNAGRVEDIWFENHTWMVRYLTSNLRKWGLRSTAPIARHLFGKIDETARTVTVHATAARLRSQTAVSEHHLHLLRSSRTRHRFGFAFYCGAESLIGGSATDTLYAIEAERLSSPCLLSTRDLVSQTLKARDGSIGSVEDLLVDGRTWTARHLVVRIDPNRLVLVPVELVGAVNVGIREIRVDPSAESIRNCPAFLPQYSLHPAFEEVVLHHYERAQSGATA